MADIAAMTAANILSIPVTEPERLFTGDVDSAKKEYRQLSMLWHPDHAPATQKSQKDWVNVFAHVTALYDAAKKHIKNGIWHIPGQLNITSLDGHCYRLRYQKKHEFELGQAYIGKTIIAYAIKPDAADLFENATKVISGFRYHDDKMRAEISRWLPQVEKAVKASDSLYLILKKSENMVPLADLLSHLGGKLEPVHVAWILNTAFNLACYLEYAAVSNNAISLENFFVDPTDHSGAILGGWWYGATMGQKLMAAPGRTVNLMSSDVLMKKVSDPRIDLELIRAMGRELLGDPTGAKLARDTSVPAPMLQFLRSATAGHARKDYAGWAKALESSFGKRRFVELNVTPSDIYKE